MIWFDKVTKRFWVCKLGLSAAFDYICSAPSRKIVKRNLLTDEFDLHRQISSESLWDIGLLLGKMVKRRHHIFTYSAGLGYVGGRIRGDFIPDESGWGGLQKMKKASSIGIPFEIQYIRTVSANVGIGLTAFGDLNPVQSFGGITLSLHLGQLP